jgi:hypothetical protein
LSTVRPWRPTARNGRAPAFRPRDLGFRLYILRVVARTIVQIDMIRSIVEILVLPVARSVIDELGVEVL